MRNSWWLFGYLQVMDILTTISFLSRGQQEGNPLARYVLANVHPVLVALLLFKGGLFLLAWALMLALRWQVASAMLRMLNVSGAVVVFWNVINNI